MPVGGTGAVGGTTVEDVSSTSRIRSAETSALGTIMNIITAIITAMRICMM